MIEIPPRFAGRKPVGPIPPGEREPSLLRAKIGQVRVVSPKTFVAMAHGCVLKRKNRFASITQRLRSRQIWLKVDPDSHYAYRTAPHSNRMAVGSHGKVFQIPHTGTLKYLYYPHLYFSTRAGKGAYLEPLVEGDTYRFEVKMGKPPESAEEGTKLSRGAFRCIVSDAPMVTNISMTRQTRSAWVFDS